MPHLSPLAWIFLYFLAWTILLHFFTSLEYHYLSINNFPCPLSS